MPIVLVIKIYLFACLLTGLSLVFPPDSLAIECYQCHGSTNPPDYRPKDDANRNIQTGGFQGSHRKHMDASASPATCTMCHPGSDNYGPNHRDGQIFVSLAEYSPAVYRNGSTLFLQRPDPRLGRCTNVYCHRDGTSSTNTSVTPVWGSSGNSCSACHGNPPAYASGSPKANSHPKHRNSCNNCHYSTTTNGSFITGPELHRNGAYEVSSQNGSVNYNPADKKCSANNCHSDGTSVSTGAAFSNLSTPAWGTEGTFNCGSCHGNPPGYVNGSPKANAHLKHNFYGYSCSKCHYATTRNGSTISSYSSSHGDNSYTVNTPPGETIGYSFDPNGGSCSTSYCHSTAQGTTDPTQPPAYRTVSWNQQYGEGCHACHFAGYHWDYFIPYMASGNHKKHLDYDSGIGCTSCHYQPYYAGKSCDQCHLIYNGGHTNSSARGPEHANGVIDVNIDPNMPVPGATGSYSGDPAPGTPYGNCSDLYCHSQGTRQLPPFESPNVSNLKWGGNALPADCTGCHGGDAHSSIPIITGSHTKHDAAGCSTCHNITASSNRSAIPVSPIPGYQIHTNKSYHANGHVNVAMGPTIGGQYGTDTTSWDKLPGTARLRCTNTYCHSSGVKVATGTLFGNISTPVWGGASSCDSCHGNPPAYPDSSPKANNHLGPHAAFACNSCHFATTTNGTTITDSSRHANFGYDVTPGTGIGFSYTFATSGGNCSGVSCHPAGSAPRSWIGTSCGNCHNSPPGDQSHRKHFTGTARAAAYGNTSTTQRYLYNCGICHPQNKAMDNNGTVQVELYNPSAAAGSRKLLNSTFSAYNATGPVLIDEMGVAYRNGNCGNIYCHSSGVNVATGQTPASSLVSWNGPAMTCNNCHTSPPAYDSGSPKSNSHQNHTGYGCPSCHQAVTTNASTIADPLRHIDGRYDVDPAAGIGFAYSYAATGGSCGNVSCHNTGTGVATGSIIFAANQPAWGGSIACGDCHAIPPAYTGNSPKANSHARHAAAGNGCEICHHSVTTDGASITTPALHANGVYNVIPSSGTSFGYTFATGGGSCSTVSCHGDGTIVATGTASSTGVSTWGATLDCSGCHQNPPAYANGTVKANSHAKHDTNCSLCHFAVTATGNTITTPVNHGNGSYNVNQGSGISFSYSYATNPDHSRGGSCAAVSCHSNGTGIATGTTTPLPAISWGDSYSCSSCHGNPPSYASGSPKKNSHLGGHSPYGCHYCHYDVTTNTSTITNKTLHANGQYTVAPGHWADNIANLFNYTYSANGGTCFNIACHSDGTFLVARAYRSPQATWGGTGGCTLCHAMPPNYANNSPKKNSHMGGHASLSCQKCHYSVTTNGTTIADPAKHKNGKYEIAASPGLFFRYTSAKVNGNGGYCKNIVCHSDGTSIATGVPRTAYLNGINNWGGSALTCSECHQRPPWYANGSPKANSHVRHWQYSFKCQDCHYSVTRDDGSTIYNNTPLHKNGSYDVTPVTGGRSFSYIYNGGIGSCSVIYCHGDGTSVATGTITGQTSANWGGTSMQQGCSSCHGYPPAYPNGFPKKNSHGKHAAYGYSCTECHSSSISVSWYYHINKQYDVNGPKLASGYIFINTGGRCSTNYCHSNGTSVATGTMPYTSFVYWGDTQGCNSCHGNPPNYGDRSPKGNAHYQHASYGCQVCHASVTTNGTTIVDRTKHVNGRYEIAGNGSAFFNYTSIAGVGSCSNISCHAPDRQGVNWRFAAFPYMMQPAYGSPAPVTTPVSFQFSDDMDPTTINSSTFLLDNGVTGTVSYDQATKTATFTPSQPLDYNNIYTVTLASGIRNIYGEKFIYDGSWQFSTEKGAQFRAIKSESFDSGGTQAFTWLTPSCTPTGACWTLQSQSTPFTAEGNNGPYASVYAPTTGTDAMLVSSPIDLSGYQSAELTMHLQQISYTVAQPPWYDRFNYYYATVDLEISINGTSGPWTKVLFGSNGYPYLTSVNLSSYVKGQPNVAIRLRYYNAPAGPTAGYVDNITISGDPR